MKAYDVIMWATVREVITVEAADEDDAIEVALEIAKHGYTVHSELDWEIDEVNLGSSLDVAE